jgi:hypothetical protein
MLYMCHFLFFRSLGEQVMLMLCYVQISNYSLCLRIEGHLTFKIYPIIKGLLAFQYELYLYLFPFLLFLVFCALSISLFLLNSRAQHLNDISFWDRGSML